MHPFRSSNPTCNNCVRNRWAAMADDLTEQLCQLDGEDMLAAVKEALLSNLEVSRIP
jgi:hypothetical protein